MGGATESDEAMAWFVEKANLRVRMAIIIICIPS
jgi:hypothetical protein